MARSRLELVIEAQNQAKSTLDNLSRQLGRLAGDQDRLADSTRRGEQSFLGFSAAVAAGNIAARFAERALFSLGRTFTGFIKSSIDTALSV